MIEAPARVTRVAGPHAWVISEAPASCGACGGKGCGSSAFNRLWHPDTPEYQVDNALGAEPGEAVVIGMAEGALLRATGLGYLLPLLALLGGAGLGQWLGGELAAALAGLIALVLAGVWLRRHPGRVSEPMILRRGTTTCASSEH